MARRVLYLAAHGGFAGEPVALGGGAAVCNRLLEEWQKTRPFEVELISPAILGESAPGARELIGYGESRYAQFCFDFRRAATEAVLKHDPASTTVLCNDVSEGPDFERLAGAGFPIVTIYHVDVVAYVTAIYGRSLVRPETAVRWFSRLRWMPLPSNIRNMAGLIFDQQEASVRYSHAAVVPSSGMRDVMQRCYPWLPRERVRTVPWGVSDESWSEEEIRVEVARLREEFGIPGDAMVLLTLSRISPEKGQDLLLDALKELEPARPLWLFICGDAAYMQGQRFLARLQQMATSLRKTRVVFPGYVTGLRKRAFFSLADAYVFPSRHESYGLTLLEALSAGQPAVCLDHAGAREVMSPDFGFLVPASSLRDALAAILSDDERRKQMGQAAKIYASTQRFSDSAAAVAQILLEAQAVRVEASSSQRA